MKIQNRHYRTIWMEKESPSSVFIIDQRQLPHQFVIEKLTCCKDTWKAIKEMHVRGAGLIGATAGYGMYLASLEAPATSETEFMTALQKAGVYLNSSRPTAKNLSWAVSRILERAAAIPSGIPEKKQAILECAKAIADEDAAFCRSIGQYGKEIITEISKKKEGKPVNILTHCNAGWLAFVDYGSATAPIYAARDAGVNLHVWVDETRPWLQGAKLTAWELQQEGIPCTLITDNTGGHLMQRGDVDMVIVGTDRTTRSGDVANKIGTYLKALAARDNNIPFYVALPSSTFDWQIDRGADIPIEVRSGDEILSISGMTKEGKKTDIFIASPETEALNYSFDITPARLITALITERGCTKANKEDIAALFPEHTQFLKK